jgi:hypothetical protein
MTSVCTNYTKANRYGLLPLSIKGKNKTEGKELLRVAREVVGMEEIKLSMLTSLSVDQKATTSDSEPV